MRASVTVVLWTCLLTSPVLSRASDASPETVVKGYLAGTYYSRDTTRYLSPEADSAGDGCYAVAADRWRVRGTRRYGNSAEVHVDVWELAESGCEGTMRYWPPKRTRLVYNLRRTSGQWKLVTYHPVLPRRSATRYRNSPFYLVIAGSFRDETAASHHAEWVAMKTGDDLGPTVRESAELAGLQPGWKVVVPTGGECFSSGEAFNVRKRLATAGVPVYVARIR